MLMNISPVSFKGQYTLTNAAGKVEVQRQTSMQEDLSLLEKARKNNHLDKAGSSHKFINKVFVSEDQKELGVNVYYDDSRDPQLMYSYKVSDDGDKLTISTIHDGEVDSTTISNKELNVQLDATEDKEMINKNRSIVSDMLQSVFLSYK